MQKLYPLLLISILLAGCSSHQAASSKSGEDASAASATEARLVLSGYPRQGFQPMRVSFSVVLEGVAENDAEYYCLHQEWDFGDGAVSGEQPNCVPFTEDTKINLHFFAEHIFDDPGNYTIRFKLGEPLKIRSNQISVLVLERERGR